MSVISSRPRVVEPNVESPVSIGRGWVVLIFGGLTLAILGMFARVVQLQTQPSEQLVAQMSDRTSSVVEEGRRGDVLDRRGRLLAATRFGQRAIVDPSEFPKKDIEKHLLALSEALGQPLSVVGPRILNAIAENERRENAFHRKFEYRPELTAEEIEEDAATEAARAQAALAAPAAEAGDAAATEEREFSPKPPSKPRLIKYLVMSDVLDDNTLSSVRKLKLPGFHLESRAVREMASPEIAAVMVGKVDYGDRGVLAAEKLLDERLQPKDGSFSFVRDARGRPLWMEPGAYTPSQRGEDVRLSFDLGLQRLLTKELERGVLEADAQGGRAVLLDSHTGEILAMADMIRRPSDVVDYDWMTLIPKDKRLDGPRYVTVRDDPARRTHPAMARNRVVEEIYEPGSTFKSFVWAAVVEKGRATPDEVFNTHWGEWTTPYGRSIRDVVKRATMTWREVLVNSSNVGMVQGGARLTFEELRSTLIAFGFGRRVNIGVAGESAGMVTPMSRWTKITQTSVSFGHEVAVTPLQMARAFCAFARDGELAGSIPELSLTARIGPDGMPITDPGQRAVSAKTALAARETMRGVTANLDKKLALREVPESGWRYELFGKSGTADVPMTTPPPGKRRPKGSEGYFRGQYNATFVAGGPAIHPRLVCVVVIDDPGRELIAKKLHYGTYVAGPIVRRVMDQALAYLGEPASEMPTNLPAHAD
jgi:cell division protein FtsI (penicillin-binding protein 3)